MSDKLDERRKQAIADAKRVRAFTEMVTTEGWKYYLELLNLRLGETFSSVMSPSQGIDGVLASEHRKGVFFGLTLARDLPSATIQAAKDSNIPSSEQ